MARCERCNKFMFKSSISGYCDECKYIVWKEAQEKEKAETERKHLDEQRKEEELKRLEEQKKLEEQRIIEQRREEQKPLFTSSFELRKGIHFGDEIEQVKAKETNRFDDEYKSKNTNRIAYHGTITGALEVGDTIYTFNDIGLLINMGYSFVNRCSSEEWFMYRNNRYSKLYVDFQKKLTDKYGKPIYWDSIINKTVKEPADGEEYSLVMNSVLLFDECYQHSDEPYISNTHGWVITGMGENDIIIHLSYSEAGYTEYVEVGYSIMQHSDVVRYMCQDAVRIQQEKEEKERKEQTAFDEI